MGSPMPGSGDATGHSLDLEASIPLSYVGCGLLFCDTKVEIGPTICFVCVECQYKTQRFFAWARTIHTCMYSKPVHATTLEIVQGPTVTPWEGVSHRPGLKIAHG